MSHSGQPAVAEDGQVQDTKAAARRWPSDDPAELAAQLGRQLRRLDTPSEDDDLEDVLRLATAYLKHAQALAWRGVGRGDLDAPRALLDALLIAHPFLDAHLPELDLAARAAVEIHATFQSFYVAAEALEELRTRVRLTDRRRAKVERAVMDVLAASPDRHLRRGEVHERLSVAGEEKPTVARVGQILARLYHEGLLVRLLTTAQGNPETAFYALSGLGRKLCLDAEQIDRRVPTTVEELLEKEPFRVLVDAAINPTRSADKRRVATGALAAGCLRLFSDIPSRALFAKYRELQEPEAGPTRELCRQVMLSALLARVGEHQACRSVAFRNDPDRWRTLLRDRDVSQFVALESPGAVPGHGPEAGTSQLGRTKPESLRTSTSATPGSLDGGAWKEETAEDKPAIETLYLASLGKLEPVEVSLEGR
jgi:hypothetical protein